MNLPDAIQTRLSTLETRLSKCQRKLDRLRKADKFEEHDYVRDENFIRVFRDTCALLREAELSDAPYLVELSKAADKILDDGIGYSYGRDTNPGGFGEGLYDFMPSWAHDDDGGRPLIKDKNGESFPLSIAALESFLQIFQSYFDAAGKIGALKMEPWNAPLKRHPKSTNLSRFRPNLPALTTTHGKPLAASVLNARCEISSSRCAAPIRFHMGSGNVCLALTGMAGYKNRSPALDYLILNQPMAPFANFPVLHSFEPGLASVAFHGAVDEARRLIFVGDNDRIKSYEWGNPSEVYEELLPVHTMETEDSEGPMTVLPNGSIVRAGKEGASVWDMVTLPAHGPDGDEIIGEEIEDFDTMRDDSTKSAFAVECSRVINSGNPSPERSGEVRRKTFQGPRRSPGLPIDPKRWVLVLENPTKLVTEVDEIEPSSGSPPTLHIKFLNQPNLKPSLWQPPLTAPLIVVCIKCAHEKGNYSCITIDLETGKSTSYYLGYGANVSAFSVTSANPQLFLTACNDGFACLFDIRHPLPILTFDSCGTSEFCKAAALAHPDSIPSELSHP